MNNFNVRIRINHQEIELTIPSNSVEYTSDIELRLKHTEPFIKEIIRELKKENYDS